MSDPQPVGPLTFLMGKHPAPLPGELLYCKNHMWCRPEPHGTHTFGFSAYAVRLMQDVYFLEWRIDPGLVTLMDKLLPPRDFLDHL